MSLRDSSRANWSPRGVPATEGEINVGSLQRIADASERQAAATEQSARAVELVAANYAALREDRDRYKRWYHEGQETAIRLRRRISALHGVITRLKRQARP